MITKAEQKKVIDRYTSKYHEFGYSEKTLGWDKGKQNIRFDVLTSTDDLKNKSILDIGCGFGDLYKFLNHKFDFNGTYHGIDLVPALISEGKSLYGDNKNFTIEVANFLEWIAPQRYDYIIISGIFNFKLEGNSSNYNFIHGVLKKAFFLADIGVVSNFLSNQVDYKLPHAFHSDPIKILDFGYSLTRNLSLINDYFPFEFTLALNKNNNFNKKTTIFDSYVSNYE